MPESSTTPQGRAVFLSYAREDVEQARRIADALRAFGMEVWFDQAELRGGDAWDQKIKRQIRECALFMPLISARTQERGEGYFRREWNLGVERTRDMAHGVPFIVPVVVDDTPSDEAMVPEEFMRYQWTQLKHGVPSSQFVEQVKSLLEAPRKGPGSRAPAPPQKGRVAEPSAHGSHRSHLPLVVLGGLGILVAGLVVYELLKPRRSPEEVERLMAAANSAVSLATSAAERADAAKEGAPAPAAALAISDKSVAVLPFENMSEDKDNNAFFADGIHEDILTNLALVKGLRVVSRTSVMQYRSTTKPIREIAKELGVAYILEGSVRRAGNKVRVTGQLIRAATDEHIWAKAYDRDITDVFAIQGELAQAIAGALSAAISPEEKALLERRPTENAAAYDLYLKARKLREDYASLAVTEPLLRAAVELDPKFAVAWAELGRLQANAYFADEDHTDARLAKAKDAIETATRLAPDDPSVIEDTGDYYYYGYRDYSRAAEQYLRLAQLRPNDPVMYYSLALIHRRQGHWGDALLNFRRAIELDPADLPHADQFLQFLFGTRHYDEAEALGRRLSQAFPDRVLPAGFLAITEFLHTGATKDVETFLRQKFTPSDSELFAWTAKISARMTGDLTEAVRLDRERPYVEGVGYSHWQQDVDTAQVLMEAGERDAAWAKIDSAMPVMTAELASQPSNASLWESLAEAHAIKGEKDEAIRCCEKAMELIPESRDAVEGPIISLVRASILAQVGDKDRALAEFARLIRVPYAGAYVHVARNGIWFGTSFRALRGDPRFEALLNDPANNAPAF